MSSFGREIRFEGPRREVREKGKLRVVRRLELQREAMDLCLSAWERLSGPMQYNRLVLARILMVTLGYA